MSLIRVSKEFTFEMAHALLNYEGKCANIHGHSYHLTVTLIGKPQHVINQGDNGMVMDFTKLKAIVENEIIKPFDHTLVLNEADPVIGFLIEQNFKVVKAKYQPTCENMLIDFARRLQSKMYGDVKLHSMKLRETGTCYSEWFAEDNQ